MHFDTALNLVWALLGILALGAVSHSNFYRNFEENRRSKRLHLVGLGLIVVALFPYVSATDDVLRIEHYRSQHETAIQDNAHSDASTGSQAQINDLMRLYEVIDSALVCRVAQIFFTLAFVALLFSPALRLTYRSAPNCSGRSPPLFS
ncbi:MAG TPA: hypothetical protein VLN58_15410 [Verrucomicrobiae bacterium]|nr:hypothetical protein [Verrucomicrobiae bacterium]